jgi:hypothetical protein
MGTNNGKVTSVISNSYKYGEVGRLGLMIATTMMKMKKKKRLTMVENHAQLQRKGTLGLIRRLKPEEEYKAEMEYCKKNGIPVRIVRVRDEITRSG